MNTKNQHIYIFLFASFLIAGFLFADGTQASGLENQGNLEIDNLLVGEALQGGRDEVVYMPIVRLAAEESWPMAGANPERTSWTPTEVKGNLNAAWFKPFDAFILPHTQIIAANGLLYLSTANGLYALNASSGAQAWVYPTEMPLGNSPTVSQGVVYVGGFDKKIHAVDALTGAGLWTFEAKAGFDTNPLIVGGILYAGSRDGDFYAIHTTGANAGELFWKYTTGAPIHYSAAYKDGIVYFASNTSRVYALNAQTGAVVWQSAILPGSGFHAWWPVIYGDYVIVAGSQNYRFSSDLGPGSLLSNEKLELYPHYAQDPRGTLVGPLSATPGAWVAGTPTIDASHASNTSNGQTQAITQYFEAKPWRRTYFVFNRLTGVEYTSDFDSDGNPEYAPMLWMGFKGAGNRYPPVVGADNVLYQANAYMSDPVIPGGHLTGWTPGSPYLSVISSDWGAVDEPFAYSAGGEVIYWNLCCDRQVGAIDISIPNTVFKSRYDGGIRPPTGGMDTDREWLYVNYDIDDKIPGYNVKYYGGPLDTYASFGNQNGVYGYHGFQNAPVPYNGMVYIHRSNAVIAFTPQNVNPISLPVAQIVAAPDQTTPVPVDELIVRLEGEVQKIIEAGHLMPGYTSSGIFDLRAKSDCGDDLVDYWHAPGEMLVVLINALPYLSPDLQDATRAYLQDEFANFPPYTYNHIGWQDGVSRDFYILPPEVEAARASYPPKTINNNFEGWGFNPQAFYAMWKYAEEFGGAGTIFIAALGRLEVPPINAILTETPQALNAYIAGYEGFLKLEALAGLPISLDIQGILNTLYVLRSATFSKDAPPGFFNDPTKFYCRSLNVSRNFMYLTPELGDYLHDNALTKVETAMNEYESLAPYWFVSRLDAGFGEAVINPFYDYHAMFQAKALIMQEPYDTLVNYLDVPAVARGDLFYIQNLITLIEIGAP